MEEVAMPFLHLFSKGAQVLNAGLPFHLEGRHFARIVCLGGWFLEDCAIFDQGLFWGSIKVLLKCTIHYVYAQFVL